MTTPVTVDVDPGVMRFVVAKDDLEKAIESTEKVSVRLIPERIVVSVGYNGRYSKKNYEAQIKKLTQIPHGTFGWIDPLVCRDFSRKFPGGFHLKLSA